MSGENIGKEVVWLNGKVSDFQSSMVSVLDRGFLFGDGVYEVVRAYGGRLFELEGHLQRFDRSAKGVYLKIPMPLDELGSLVEQLLESCGFAEAEVYFQLTRGAAPRQHAFPTGVDPTLLIAVYEARTYPDELYTDGCKVVMLPDQRWGRCDIKSINLLPNVIAKERAHELEAFEAILVRDGIVTEGSSCNVFIASAGELITAPEGPQILTGVTRTAIIEIAAKIGRKVVERNFTADELLNADEVMLSSTTMGVVPVVLVDDKQIADGVAGPIAKELNDELQRLVRQ